MNNPPSSCKRYRRSSLIRRLSVPIALAAVIPFLSPDLAGAQSAVPGAVNTLGQVPNAAATPASNSVLHLVLGLNGIKRAERDAYLKTQYTPSSPNYHKWLTPDQYGEKYGASQQDVEAVVAYAKSQGFTVTKVWPNRSFVSVDASVSQVEAAFGINLRGYNRPAYLVAKGEPATFYAPSAAPSVSSAVAPKIAFIGGLTNLALLHHGAAAPGVKPIDPISFTPGGNPYSGAVSPAQLSEVYNFDALHNLSAQGDGQTIAIYSPTLRYATDITTFASNYGIAGYTVNDIYVNGGPADYSGSGEAALDGEVILGQANHATINYYSPPNTSQDLLDAYNKIATDNPSVLTSSWSISESILQTYGLASYAQAYDDIVAQMANQGISVFNDSGDWGAYDPSNHASVTVQMQAASPNVTGVGGTSLPSSNNGAWEAEDPWSFDGSVGSAGGLSVFFPKPWWQDAPGVNNAYSNGFRQVPDVAALAWAPFYNIYANGSWGSWYGTSASTPLWASATLLMNQLSGFRQGNLNSALYDIAKNRPYPFHDIIGGSDGVYSGTTGWDYITGIGSADFGRLYNDLTRPSDLATFNPTGYVAGWNNTIMIHSDPTSVAEPAQFDDVTTYYIDSSMANYGPADMPSAMVKILVDSTPQTYNTPALPLFNFTWTGNLFPQKFTAGRHTITEVVNPNHTIWENNYNNNTFVRNINVVHVAQPTITSVTPNPIAYGSTGQTLTINGTDFINTAAVNINGTPVSTVFISNTQLTASVNAAAFTSSAPIAVTVTEGAFSSNTYYVSINNAPTTLSISSTPAAPVSNKPITLTATVSDPSSAVVPTGSVTFKKGASVLGTATLGYTTGYSAAASITLPGGISGGPNTITMVYSGDSTFAAKTGTGIITTIAALASQTTILASPASTVYSQGVVFTVKATGAGPVPTGSIALTIGSQTTTVPIVNGIAYIGKTLLMGSNSVYAKYLGDGTYLPSTSPTITVVVSKMSTTTTVMSSVPSSTFGQAVTLTALVKPVAPAAGPVTGSVQFLDGATSLGAVTLDGSGYAKLTKSNFAIGSHTITANYLGTSNANVSSGQVTQTVTQAKPTIALTGSNIVLSKQSNAITVTLTGATGTYPTGTATFMDGANTYATKTLLNGVATINTNALTVGAHSFKVVYSGDTNYKTVTSTTLSVSVKDNTTVTVLAASPASVSYGTAITFTATVNPTAAGFGAATGSVKFREGTTDLGTVTLVNGVATYLNSSLAPGSHTIVAVYVGDTKYKTSTSTGKVVTISPDVPG